MNKITIESDGSLIGTKVTVNGKEIQVTAIHVMANANPFSVACIAGVIDNNGDFAYTDLLKDDCSGLAEIK